MLLYQIPPFTPTLLSHSLKLTTSNFSTTLLSVAFCHLFWSCTPVFHPAVFYHPCSIESSPELPSCTEGCQLSCSWPSLMQAMHEYPHVCVYVMYRTTRNAYSISVVAMQQRPSCMFCIRGNEIWLPASLQFVSLIMHIIFAYR